MTDDLDPAREVVSLYAAMGHDPATELTAAEVWTVLRAASDSTRNWMLDKILDAAHDGRRYGRRLEQAEARVDQLTDTLTLRSDALNRTAASNDQLRATIARIEKQAAALEELAEQSLTDPTDLLLAARSIRAALADQEPA